MAHKKAGGSTSNGRDSRGRRLGIKCSDGEIITAGSIIVRQRGNKFYPGVNVSQAKDFSLFSLVDGKVVFKRGKRNTVTVVATAA